MKKSEWLDCQGNEYFPKTKGDSITGQDREQKHCDFRFSQIEKKSKVAVLQLRPNVQNVKFPIQKERQDILKALASSFLKTRPIP